MATAPISSDDPELTKLLNAVEQGDLRTVTALVSARPALVHAHGAEGQTALHAAAQCDDVKIGAYLVKAGADLEAKLGQSGHTALSWAVVCHAISFAKAMLQLGATADLFCAAGIGALDAVEACFDETGALRPGASSTGSTRFGPGGVRLPCPPLSAVEQISDALYMACRNGQTSVARFLLTKSPDLSFRAYGGGTPLHWAYFGGSPGVIDVLLLAGADPTLRDDDLKTTPRAFGICTLANWGFGFLVRARLAQDPTLATVLDGTSALHEAAREGHLEVVQILLEAGAHRASRDRDGRTAAELARERGHLEVAAAIERATPTM